MFTGLIEATAEVLDQSGSTLTIFRPPDFDDVKIGSSICVSGACLSIVELTDVYMRFDLLEETLNRTTIGNWKSGDHVNVERAMKMGDRFEGHVVQGHVDGVGEVVKAGEGLEGLKVLYPSSFKNLIVEKGSIAVDGVSLTVISVDPSTSSGEPNVTFSVALIPQTLKETTLGNLKKGDFINLEADVMGKYKKSITAK